MTIVADAFVQSSPRLPAAWSRRVWVWAIVVLGIVGFLGLQAIRPDIRWLSLFGRIQSPGMLLAVFLASLLCEYVDSSLGMGYGTTLTPLLLAAGFETLRIVPCVLLSEFFSGLSAAALHHRDGNVDFRRDRQARNAAVLLSTLSAVGALSAVFFAIQLPKAWLKGLVGAIVLSMGIVTLATVRRRMAYRSHRMILLGAVAAFNKGLSGGGYGPLVTAGQVVSGLDAKKAVAVTSLAESVTCLVGLTAYAMLTGPIDLRLGAPLVAGALLSVPVATLTVRYLPERLMRVGVGLVTSLLGLFTLAKLIW